MPSRLILSFLLLALPALCHGQEDNAQDNVVVILDGSGSMSAPMGGTSRMQAAKRALFKAINQLPEDTNFGLLVFSSSHDGWIYPLSPLNKVEAWKNVQKIREGGKTPLGHYIKTAGDSLLRERAKQFNYGSYRIIVITDGESTDGNLMERFARESVGRGLTLNVVGVGMTRDHTLKGLAHQYVGANDIDALNAAVTSFVAEAPVNMKLDEGQTPYSYLAFFPDDAAALQAIDALSETGNHPLGTKP